MEHSYPQKMKNKPFLLCCSVFICLSGVSNNLSAQTFESIRKQFPDEKAVMLNRTLEYNINLKNGQPYVESNEVQQIEYLLGTATAYMGQYGFSHSDFQELVSYNAYTRTPDDKKLKVSEFKTSTDKE